MFHKTRRYILRTTDNFDIEVERAIRYVRDNATPEEFDSFYSCLKKTIAEIWKDPNEMSASAYPGLLDIYLAGNVPQCTFLGIIQNFGIVFSIYEDEENICLLRGMPLIKDLFLETYAQ